jgi:hypothetical protein
MYIYGVMDEDILVSVARWRGGLQRKPEIA